MLQILTIGAILWLGVISMPGSSPVVLPSFNQFCKVPRVNKKTKVVSDLVDPRNNGKKIGRKIETETELVYDNEDPSLAENWSDLKVGRPVADEMAGVVPGEHPSNVRLRRAVLPTMVQFQTRVPEAPEICSPAPS